MTPAHRDHPDRTYAGAAQAATAAAVLLASAIALWAILCGLGYLLTHPLHDTAFERWDGSVNGWFAARRSAPWNTLTHWITYAGETLTVCTLGLIGVIALRLVLHQWRESIFLAVALIGEVTIFVSTTAIIDRTRPPVPHLDAAPPTSSFPSGHTAAAVVLFGALAIIANRAAAPAWLRRLALIIAFLAPIGVAIARIYRGMHYPTDTIASIILGLAWLAITSAVIFHGQGKREAVPSTQPQASVLSAGERRG
jgi:undecaprenyl-diphosphatase